MSKIDALNVYKQNIFRLCQSNEKRFLEDSFTRWYFRSLNGGELPVKPLILEQDLKYANANKQCNFNIENMMKQNSILFKKFKRQLINSNENYKNKDKLISVAQLDRLRKLYTGNNFEHDKNKLISLYEFLGINTIHLSIPRIMKFKAELFGSPLNTANPFCSPFKFEVEKFSSLGNFFDFKFDEDGVYSANPPFDEDIIKMMALQLNIILDTQKKIDLIITIPVWDSISQRQLNIRDYGLPFEGYEILCKSSYFKSKYLLDKFQYLYYDYFKNKHVPASYTHLILLSNYETQFTLDEFMKKWRN